MILQKRFLLVVMMLAGVLLAQQLRTISQDNIHLRQGPGCYYPLLKVLNTGDTVEVKAVKMGWAQVSHHDTLGWICENCFGQQPVGKNLSDDLQFDTTATAISKITAGGAVKGFAVKTMAYEYAGDKNVIFKSHLDPDYYMAIKNSMKNNRLSDRKYRSLTKPDKDFHIDGRLLRIGNSVSRQIAARGLVEDQKQLAYLNAIGTLVLEETDLYYYPMKFFIVDEEKKGAFATPNGMVFVTKGLLDLVEDEAELACLLAHEISHVIYQHGYEELEKRQPQIIAEDAFSQMEMEIAEEMSADEAELEDLSAKFYDNATASRQLGYEYEADKMGAIFASKAGYDPYALTRLLARIKESEEIDYENFESNWEKHYIKDRIKKVSNFIGKHLEPNNIRNRSRYQSIFG
ncbi:MAG: M48 family metalloprotease [Candidatus Marinimicrobia bacterium]|nr:M48 family metalloprotease [Candidatus Neomarinimicrobiota bacterium]